MSEKSVIDIDVHDAAFQAFLKAFLEFSDSLSDIPRDWAKVDKAIGATAPKMRKVNGESEKSAKAVAKGIDQATKAQKGLEKATGRSAAAMSRLGKEAKQVGHVLKFIAGFAMKFSAIGMGLTGIGGAASLFGITDLASTAMNRQKSARGMGMTIGQQTALKNYGSRLFNDPLSVAQQAAEAKSNPQAAIPFEMLGYSYSQVLRRSVPSLVFGAARREKALIGSNPQTAIMYSQNTALGAIASPSDLLRLQRTSNGAINAAQASYRAAVPKDEIARAAADRDALMIQQVRQSKWEVERSIIVALSKLSPEISEARKGLAQFVSGLIDSKPVAHFISHLGTKLQNLESYLESKSFQSALMKFGSGVELVGEEIWGVAQKLKFLLPHQPAGQHGNGKFKNPKSNPYNWNDHAKGFLGFGYDKYEGPDYYKTNPDNPANKGGLYTNPSDWRKYNDPGNVDPTFHGHNAYKKFRSMNAGYRAMVGIVRGYKVPSTVNSITAMYEAGGNQTPLAMAHAHQIANWMGVHGNQNINLSNPAVVSGLVAGLAEFEQHHVRGYAQLKQAIVQAVVEGMSKAQVHVHTPSVATGSHPALSHYAASR